jgi:hypothetical protein
MVLAPPSAKQAAEIAISYSIKVKYDFFRRAFECESAAVVLDKFARRARGNAFLVCCGNYALLC